MHHEEPLHQEGKTTFHIGSAFYNPRSQIVRDLGVLAAAVYRRAVGHLRVIDAMAGSGVRSLRYALESGADWVWVNDRNSDIQAVLQGNLERSLTPSHYQITQWDANRLFFDCYIRQDFYDLVDVDAFGSLVPYLQTSLWTPRIGGLLYLTSTDGRATSGQCPDQSLARYGAYGRSHPAIHEQGLRMIIGHGQQQAAAKGLGLQPLFSFFTGDSYRVMVRLIPDSQLHLQTYGFLGYCHQCGQYETIAWAKLGRVACPCTAPLVVSGPLWLGQLHNPDFTGQMIHLATQWEWQKPLHLLRQMQMEADLPPYFYTLREIGRRGNLNLPKRSHLIQTLQDWGYAATATHIHPQAIKTTADLKTCILAAQVTPNAAE